MTFLDTLKQNFLVGPAETEKRRQQWNDLVEKNPGMAGDTDTRDQFLQSGFLPTKYKSPQFQGIKFSPDLTPTDVTKPVRFSNEPIPVSVDKEGKATALQLPPDLQGKPLKFLTPNEMGGKPKSMDQMIAEKVSSGEWTWEQAAAYKRQASPSASYFLSPEEEDALTKAVKRGILPASFLTSRGPRSKIIARALIEDPNYRPTEAELGYSSSKSGATAESHAAGAALGRLEPAMKSLDDFLDFAKVYVPGLSPSQLQMVNSAYTKGLLQVNDPDANAFLTHLNEATQQYAQILKGGNASPTDEDVRHAREVLRLGLSERGFDAVSDAIKKATVSKVSRLREQLRQSPDEMDKPADRNGENKNEVVRKTKDGRLAVFDSNTKQFLRYQ